MLRSPSAIVVSMIVAGRAEVTWVKWPDSLRKSLHGQADVFVMSMLWGGNYSMRLTGLEEAHQEHVVYMTFLTAAFAWGCPKMSVCIAYSAGACFVHVIMVLPVIELPVLEFIRCILDTGICSPYHSAWNIIVTFYVPISWERSNGRLYIKQYYNVKPGFNIGNLL